MNSNYMQVVTMRHYDEAGTPEEKREIAKGFEDALDKTAELNAKYIAEIAALKAENERLRVLAEKQTPCEINDYIDENYERHMECPICGCDQMPSIYTIARAVGRN